MKKQVKKPSVSKKAVVRKPMMKKGGPAKRLKKYQDEGEVSPPMPAPGTTPSPTPTTTSARTLAQAYQDNINAGLSPRRARVNAEREVGIRGQKGRNASAFINAAGNILPAVINAAAGRNNPAPSPMSPFKKGGAKLECKKCGGAKKMQKGGTTKIVGMPQYDNNPRTQGRILKKGGSSKSFPDLNKDGEITQADILKGRGVIKKKGGMTKAKFGSSVPVQHSPKPGRVRAASGVGTVPVGKRKMGGAIKKKK